MKQQSLSTTTFLLVWSICSTMTTCVAFSSARPPTFVSSIARQSTVVSSSASSSSSSNEWGIPDSNDLPSLLSPGALVTSQLPNGGKVTLVGSGPGDPELLTMAAIKLLTDPNVFVICDRLVSQEIVDLIAGPIRVARKMPGCAELAQEEIYWWAHEALQEGKHVVRLKIGDPFVFGRGGEEVLTFRRFGVEPKVIPVSIDAFRHNMVFVYIYSR